VPLVVQGQLIGVLCVGDAESRAFTPAQVQLLKLTADRAAVAIDNARLYERTQSVAESLQRSLLPKRLPASRAADIAVRYLPAVHGMHVGGDWYDAAELADDKLAVMIGDVAGHGIEAAAAMGQVRNALRAFALDGHGPAEALERLNRIHALEDAMVTVTYLVFDAQTLSARFASAGHPPPLLIHPGGRAEYLEGGRSVPLGVPSGKYEERAVELEPESTVLLYTDGLIERRDVGLEVGFERLVEAASDANGDLEAFASHVISEMVGNERRRDDVALIALRVR
jgi:serine phosphatase RsbU (regulator of sigma subunit)